MEDLDSQLKRILGDASSPQNGHHQFGIGFIRAINVEGEGEFTQPDEKGKLCCGRVIELLKEGQLNHLFILGGPNLTIGDREVAIAPVYRSYINHLLRRQYSDWKDLRLPITCFPGEGRLESDLLAADEAIQKVANALGGKADAPRFTHVFIGTKQDHRLAQNAAREMVSVVEFAFENPDGNTTRWSNWWSSLKTIFVRSGRRQER